MGPGSRLPTAPTRQPPALTHRHRLPQRPRPGSLQRHVLHKWTEAKGRRALFPIVGTVRCWRSLHGPRHRPSGTGLSSAIMAAPLVAAPSTCAPGHLAAQHARAMRRRTLDCGSDCAPMGHRHSASHRGRTHGYVVSAEPLDMACSSLMTCWTSAAGRHERL